jgi:hypothetical protein
LVTTFNILSFPSQKVTLNLAAGLKYKGKFEINKCKRESPILNNKHDLGVIYNIEILICSTKYEILLYYHLQVSHIVYVYIILPVGYF